ncbi:MAG: hypothetical protein L6Q29_03540 [Candidatus Pacebacteria bacterium]|nr:hypothetical protein [Candidatus Paceibacterota bacterium]
MRSKKEITQYWKDETIKQAKTLSDRSINKGRAPKCPKCGSNNTTLNVDDSDEWADLCILCFSCGYDEREIKIKLKVNK